MTLSTPSSIPPQAVRKKSSSAFRTIGEVSAELGLPTHVLRFWESKFSQIKPHKRRGGHRYYRPEDVELLQEIKSLLYSEGYTIKGAQKHLRDKKKQGDEEPSLFAQREPELDSSTQGARILESVRDELQALQRLLRTVS